MMAALGVGLLLAEAQGQVLRPDVYVYHGKKVTTSRSATQPASDRARTGPAAHAPVTADAAHKLYWKGEYEKAIAAYRRLLADRPGDLRAGIGLAEAYAAVGKYQQARKALEACAEAGRRDADWHVRTSELLSVLGQYDRALSHARRAYAIRPDWAPAVLRLGQALEVLGKKAEAAATYKTVEKAIAKAGFAKDARSLVAAGEVLNRIAILTGQRASEQAQNILHNYLQEAYHRVDKSYWPANLAAGALLLEKHKHRDAAVEFALALKVNKRLPEALVGRGVIHLAAYRFEQAMAEAEKALKVNPRHADALLLKAATLMMWRKFSQVEPVLKQVLDVNPRHLKALSTLAALHYRTLNPDKAGAYIRRVEQVNPNCAELYETIAGWLSAGRQFAQAEVFFKKAMKMAPELAGPVTGLGRLYMQTGREKLAKETLKKAFAIDDYRADVLNYLKLLDQMAGFSVKETEHFIIKVDGKYDQVLLDWIPEVAERIHQEVCADFQHVPPEKTLVEIFPNQWQFSVRISGRGWIPTVGACTGRVIAMPAPDPLRGGFGQFNWAVVLRHEYTHAVTLSATKNRIPHWFTEACAVWEQPDRRNFRAVALLVGAVRSGKLYPVSELSWGFIRPQRSRGRGARSLAYAQSEWIFEYIDQTHGREAIIKMLEGFAAGWSQEKVFREILGTTEAQFDKDFAAWAEQQVASWGFDPAPTPSLAAASKQAKANPDSAKAQADLALALYRRRRRTQAMQAARKALRIEPDNKRALIVLAAALAAGKKYDEAIKVARRLERLDPKSAAAAKTLARCYIASRQWAQAIPALERYKRLLPLDPFGYKELAKIYMQLGQPKEALPNLIELHRRTMKDPKYARQVADIYRASDAPEEALHFYKQVIEINPYDAGAYEAMAALALRLKKYDLALKAMRSKSLLEPDNARTWATLAMAYYRVARAKKSRDMLAAARQAAAKAIKIDPEGYGKDVLRIIQRADF